MNKFAVFILSHGRPDNVKTYHTLRRRGYTGQIYILIDNEDKTQKQYIKNFGKEVIVFDKSEAAKITDAGDNSGKRNTVLFARNWNFVVAKELGLTHFWQLDDDYTDFQWSMNNSFDYITGRNQITKLDLILNALIEFTNNSPVDGVAFAQGGDFIGGETNGNVKNAKQGKFFDSTFRKVMNSFLFRTDKPLKFYGRMNDDVNMFITNGKRGKLFLTIPRLRVQQAPTQQTEGGLTEMYLEAGTYVKSFYTIMYNPSCAIIGLMGALHKRLHHKIKWNNSVPKIISEEYKK